MNKVEALLELEKWAREEGAMCRRHEAALAASGYDGLPDAGPRMGWHRPQGIQLDLRQGEVVLGYRGRRFSARDLESVVEKAQPLITENIALIRTQALRIERAVKDAGVVAKRPPLGEWPKGRTAQVDPRMADKAQSALDDAFCGGMVRWADPAEREAAIAELDEGGRALTEAERVNEARRLMADGMRLCRAINDKKEHLATLTAAMGKIPDDDDAIPWGTSIRWF